MLPKNIGFWSGQEGTGQRLPHRCSLSGEVLTSSPSLSTGRGQLSIFRFLRRRFQVCKIEKSELEGKMIEHLRLQSRSRVGTVPQAPRMERHPG